MIKTNQKILSVLVSGIFLFQSTAFASVPEISVWQARRAHLKNQSSPHTSLSPLLRDLNIVDQNKVGLLPGWVQSAVGPHATIERVVDVESPKAKTVLILQDIHLHLEAQENIASTIKNLSQALDKRDSNLLVGLEAGYLKKVDFKRIRSFPEPELVYQTAHVLLKSHLIDGAEYAALTYGENLLGSSSRSLPFELTGVEDKEEYAANVQALKESYPLRKQANQVVEELKHILQTQKEEHYSHQALALDKKRKLYADGTLGLVDYVGYLDGLHKSPNENIQLLVKAQKLEKGIDFEKAEQERLAFLKVLAQKCDELELKKLLDDSRRLKNHKLSSSEYYSAVRNLAKKKKIEIGKFSQVDRYFDYVITSEKINVHTVFDEISQFEDLVFSSLKPTDKAMLVWGVAKDVNLLEKLANHKLIETEWERYNTKRERIQKLNTRFNELSLTLPQRAVEFNDSWAKFEEFYKLAVARNKTMADKLGSRLTDSKSDFAVLVTGGFHSNGVLAHLKKQGFNIAVLSPTINKIDEFNDSSLDLLAGNQLPLQKLVGGDRLFLKTPTTSLTDLREKLFQLILAVLAALRIKGRAKSPDGTIQAAYKPEGSAQNEEDASLVLNYPDGSSVEAGELVSAFLNQPYPLTEALKHVIGSATDVKTAGILVGIWEVLKRRQSQLSGTIRGSSIKAQTARRHQASAGVGRAAKTPRKTRGSKRVAEATQETIGALEELIGDVLPDALAKAFRDSHSPNHAITTQYKLFIDFLLNSLFPSLQPDSLEAIAKDYFKDRIKNVNERPKRSDPKDVYPDDIANLTMELFEDWGLRDGNGIYISQEDGMVEGVVSIRWGATPILSNAGLEPTVLRIMVKEGDPIGKMAEIRKTRAAITGKGRKNEEAVQVLELSREFLNAEVVSEERIQQVMADSGFDELEARRFLLKHFLAHEYMEALFRRTTRKFQTDEPLRQAVHNELDQRFLGPSLPPAGTNRAFYESISIKGLIVNVLRKDAERNEDDQIFTEAARNHFFNLQGERAVNFPAEVIFNENTLDVTTAGDFIGVASRDAITIYDKNTLIAVRSFPIPDRTIKLPEEKEEVPQEVSPIRLKLSEDGNEVILLQKTRRNSTKKEQAGGKPEEIVTVRARKIDFTKENPKLERIEENVDPESAFDLDPVRKEPLYVIRVESYDKENKHFVYQNLEVADRSGYDKAFYDHQRASAEKPGDRVSVPAYLASAYSPAYSDKSRYLALSKTDGEIEVYEIKMVDSKVPGEPSFIRYDLVLVIDGIKTPGLKKGEEILEGLHSANALAFNHDSGRPLLAVGEGTGYIRIIDLNKAIKEVKDNIAKKKPKKFDRSLLSYAYPSDHKRLTLSTKPLTEEQKTKLARGAGTERQKIEAVNKPVRFEPVSALKFHPSYPSYLIVGSAESLVYSNVNVDEVFEGRKKVKAEVQQTKEPGRIVLFDIDGVPLPNIPKSISLSLSQMKVSAKHIGLADGGTKILSADDNGVVRFDDISLQVNVDPEGTLRAPAKTKTTKRSRARMEWIRFALLALVAFNSPYGITIGLLQGGVLIFIEELVHGLSIRARGAEVSFGMDSLGIGFSDAKAIDKAVGQLAFFSAGLLFYGLFGDLAFSPIELVGLSFVNLEAFEWVRDTIRSRNNDNEESTFESELGGLFESVQPILRQQFPNAVLIELQYDDQTIQIFDGQIRGQYPTEANNLTDRDSLRKISELVSRDDITRGKQGGVSGQKDILAKDPTTMTVIHESASLTTVLEAVKTIKSSNPDKPVVMPALMTQKAFRQQLQQSLDVDSSRELANLIRSGDLQIVGLDQWDLSTQITNTEGQIRGEILVALTEEYRSRVSEVGNLVVLSSEALSVSTPSLLASAKIALQIMIAIDVRIQDLSGRFLTSQVVLIQA